MASNNGIPGNLPILDGKNQDRWCAQMKLLFRFQDVIEMVENDVHGSSNSIEAQKKEATNRDGRALFLIHQCVDPNIF